MQSEKCARFILNHPVEIVGNSLLGFPAKVHLEPTEKHGWWIQIGDEDVELSPNLLKLGYRHLMLQKGSWKVRIVEHFLALRFFGLDNVRIVFEGEVPCMPFYGSTLEYWILIKDHIEEAGTLDVFTLKARYELVTNHERKLLVFEPCGQSSLEIEVLIDYLNDKWIAVHGFCYQIQPSKLGRIAAARALGHKHLLKYFVAMLRMIGWPHHQQWVWRGDENPVKLAETLAMHRIIDFLGALACVTPAGGMITGKVSMYLASHADDVGFVSEIPLIGLMNITSFCIDADKARGGQ